MKAQTLELSRRLARSLARGSRDLARLASLSLLAAAGLCAPASAAVSNPARVNIDISYQGIAGVKDLTAQTGAAVGEINLTWTEPGRVGALAPFAYDLRVSTLANINTQAQFLAAQPLAVFSGTVMPVPGPGGGLATVVITGLVPGQVHYFALREVDSLSAAAVWSRSSGWNQDNFAPARAPGTLRPPLEPMGVEIVAAPTSVTLSWHPTTRLDDGTPFLSTSAPTAAELIGYSVFRATAPCTQNYTLVSSVPFTTLSLSNDTGGLNYFYRVFSYNTVDKSSTAMTISSLGERSFYADDCVSMAKMAPELATELNGATNGRGEDIRVSCRRRPEDVGGIIFQSMECRAELNGVSELRGFALRSPVRLVMRSQAPAAQPTKDMGAYWHNGAEFKKVYGKVDASNQTVAVDSPNLGIYQIRALSRSAGTVFDLSNISNRAFTPNGDGLNDQIIFTYDPGPGNAAVLGRVYDIHGMFVADMRPGLVPNTLTWDGRSGGRALQGGVYVYKIEGGGKTFTGTVVLAR